MSFDEEILVAQQVTEPNWEALISDPPYSLNPIRRPERLYGRESALRKLHLAAMSGASTFVWGQKRIGKTSLLQVLAAKLAERSDTCCLLLRMGELSSLHEGEIARTIALRLVERLSLDISVPPEAQFGAGMGRLIAFIELLCSKVTVYLQARTLEETRRGLAEQSREITARMRPWVGIFGFEFIPSLAPDNSDVLRILLRNAGTLPAQKAMLALLLRPEPSIPEVRDELVTWREVGVKALMPGEEGNYGIPVSQYPQFSRWREAGRDVVVEGLMSYSIDDRQFHSKFLAQLRFSEATDADGRVRTRWRNQELT